MAITWRPATWNDIEPCLCLQPSHRGDALVGLDACLRGWQRLVDHPYFISAVLEANPPIQGYRLIGFGAAIIATCKFGNAELLDPRPDIASRIFASFDSESSVLATRDELASANAGDGVDVVLIFNARRDHILNPAERHEVEMLSVTSFAEQLAGFRIRRILSQTTSKPITDFQRRSAEFRPIAEFPDAGEVLHLMTKESAMALPGSIANVIFGFREPVLRLRESDQQLLLAALKGATDTELALRLNITLSAVKARWRSTFARIEEVMPALVSDSEDRDGRGVQKRHRVLAYVRAHMEELRPYDWRTQGDANAAGSMF